MSTLSGPSSQASRDRLRARFRLVYQELESLCASGRQGPAFHGEFLNKSVSGIHAEAGALWRITTDGPELVFQRSLGELGLTQYENARLIQKHRDLLLAAGLRPGVWRLLPGESFEDLPVINPLDRIALLATVQDGRETLVYEAFQSPNEAPEMRDASLEFMQRAAFLLTRFGHVSELGEYRRRENIWQELSRFAKAVHTSLELSDTAYVVANEGRSLLHCDRFSVVTRHGDHFKTMAVSGVETIDPHSSTAETMAQLAEAVIAAGDPLLFDGDFASLPPQLESILQQHLDQGGARGIAVFPLFTKPRPSMEEAGSQVLPLGAVIAEYFGEEKEIEALVAKMTVLQKHVCLALSNAMECHEAPFYRPLKALAQSPAWRAARGTSRWLVGLGAMVLLGAIGLIPTTFKIRAQGVLKPNATRIFAPLEGQVAELFVAHGDTVASGELLATLRNEKLEADLAFVQGELATKEELLTAKRRQRSAKTGKVDGDIAAEISQLESEVDYLRQALIIREQQLQLQALKSPVDGKVLTWNIEDRLNHRPVERGQLLFEIAQAPQTWRLELEIPERYAGCAASHAALHDGSLQLEFVTGADAGTKYQARLDRLAQRLDKNEAGLPVLTASAPVQQPPKNCSAGQTVYARIDCGERPLVYALGYDGIDFLRRLWFRL